MKAKIALVSLILVSLFSCNDETSEKIEKIQKAYFCNAEISNDSTKILYDTGNDSITFKGYNLRTNEDAYSGEYSLKLTKEKPYAFGFQCPLLKENQNYRVSVQLKGSSENVFLVAQGSAGYYKKSNTISDKDENGWNLLMLDFRNPSNFTPDYELKTYVWNTGNDTVYADDFCIEIVSY